MSAGKVGRAVPCPPRRACSVRLATQDWRTVKKLKTAKIRLRKSLDTSGVILDFGAFRQFFHSFWRITDTPLLCLRNRPGMV